MRDWYRHVTVVGDLADGLLIATDNDTVAELNEQARSHLTASRGLSGPTVDTGERTFQAGDRILCRRNQDRLDVLNGDLGTVVSVDPRQMTLTVRLDRDPETRELPGWYLTAGHADYGYALTGHKAQGVTTGRTFTIIAGGTNREWAYVAMSRGRQANTLYLANPAHGDEECTHFTHIGHHDALGGFAASLEHSHAQTAALDHPAGSPVSVDIDPLGPPPPSHDVAARVAWQIARRRTERNETEQQAPRLDLAAGR